MYGFPGTTTSRRDGYRGTECKKRRRDAGETPDSFRSAPLPNPVNAFFLFAGREMNSPASVPQSCVLCPLEYGNQAAKIARLFLLPYLGDLPCLPPSTGCITAKAE